MATKKYNKLKQDFPTSSVVAIALLAAVITITSAILLVLGVNQVANGNVAAGVFELLIGTLLMSSISVGGER